MTNKKKKTMNKEKLYCPDKQGSFRMMFGFPKPSTYRPQKWVSIKKPKEEKK
jgi:hypothetical protein